MSTASTATSATLHLRLESDGGSRGNPGIAGAGSAIADPRSAIRGETQYLAQRWEFIERATNNVAEYQGVINGFRLAAEVADRAGVPHSEVAIDVFLDSDLIVKQLTGAWKIKHADMKTLAAEARRCASDFASVSYTWVPRAQNSVADGLANRAMDDRGSGTEFLADAGSAPATTPPREEPAETAPAASAEPAAPAGAADSAAAAQPSAWHDAQQPTRLVLVRHGQTAMSAAHQFSGRSNPELTELGQRQAEALARYIGSRGGISAILSSPLARTRSTAAAIARACGMKDDAVVVKEGLIEMDFGSWDGKTFDEVRAADPEGHARCAVDTTSAPHGGESMEACYERVLGTLEEILEEYAGQTIVVVSHVHPIKSILRRGLSAGPELFRSLHLNLAGLSVVEFRRQADGDYAGLVRVVNDTHFLYR